MKKTTFKLTRAALELENVLLGKTDIPRTVFHRRMIDYYLEYDRDVNPKLLVKKRSSPDYIKKDAVEQIYLDDRREKKLLEVSKELSAVYNCKCGMNTLLFQALLTYCVVLAPAVLGGDSENEN